MFEFWVVPEVETLDALSIILIRNPKHAKTGRTAEQVQARVYGVAAGTKLEFDRRLSGLGADRFFDGDYESAGLLSAVAAEAMLNRFMSLNTITVPSKASLTKKYGSLLSWARKGGRHELLKSLHVYREDFEVFLARPRNAFAHGEPAWHVDPLVTSLAAIRTNVRVSALLEKEISESMLVR